MFLFAGKVVSERKDTIDVIVAHFNIQVDNPMCMLNQDVAKNFLNTKSIKEKYNVSADRLPRELSTDSYLLLVQFFLKATQLQKMMEDLQENTVEVRNARLLLTDHIKVRPQATHSTFTMQQCNLAKERNRSSTRRDSSATKIRSIRPGCERQCRSTSRTNPMGRRHPTRESEDATHHAIYSPSHNTFVLVVSPSREGTCRRSGCCSTVHDETRCTDGTSPRVSRRLRTGRAV